MPSLKRLFILLLLASALTACGTNTTQFTGWPKGDNVGPCSDRFLPVLTSLHPSASSAENVYFLSGIHLYALNAGNGALRWCVHASNAASNPAMALQRNVLSALVGPPPPPDGLSAITVSNHTLYACSQNNYTYAFDAESGAMLWHQTTDFANTSAPTVAGPMVYIGSNSIYALNVQNGSIRWQSPTQDAVTSSPVMENGVIYAGSYDRNIYALNALDGSKRWAYQAGGRVYVAPIVDHGTVYFGAGDDRITLSALNAQNGQQLWSLNMPMIDSSSSLAIANGILYAGIDNSLYALNAQNGTVLWHVPIATPLHPLIANGIIYVASFQQGLYALDAKNGSLLWHNPLNGMRSGYATPPVILKDKLLVETIDLGTSQSKAILHELKVKDGTENWYASVVWNISTIGVAV